MFRLAYVSWEKFYIFHKINSKHLKENYLLFILQHHVRGDDELHASNIFDNDEIVEEPMRQQ